MQKERIVRIAAMLLAVLMLLCAVPAISASALEAPAVSRVGAAYLYNIENKKVLFEQDADKQMYPAASVKVMTAVVAYEALREKMDDTVIITKEMIAGAKGNHIAIEAGEHMIVRDLFYAMLLKGANDASFVLACLSYGSVDEFVAKMNERAKEIGCVGTNFTNATGFHDEKQISTTRDLVKILREALKHENFMTFFSETVFRLPANDLHGARYMETPNYMMTDTITQEYYDVRVTGGRTGVTEARERCLIVTAQSKGLHYIAIVMCAKATYDDEGKIVRFGSYEEVKQLINKGFSNHRVTQVLSDEQILTQYPVASGENSVTVGPSETYYTVLPSDILSTDLSYRYQSAPALTAPVKAGEYITSVQVWYGNVCVAQSPIVTKNSSDVAVVADQSVYIEQTGDGLRIFLRLLAILGVLLLFAGLILVTVRLVRQAKLRAQHRRRRRNRRRSR